MLVFYTYIFFLYKIGRHVFCGATDTCFGILVTDALGFNARVNLIAHVRRNSREKQRKCLRLSERTSETLQNATHSLYQSLPLQLSSSRLLQRGSMFVLSTRQFQSLMQIPEDFKYEKLLDLGKLHVLLLERKWKS